MKKEPGIYVGFSVNFTHESLRNYHHLHADAEQQIRNHYLNALLGAKRAELAAKFSGMYRPMPSGSVSGHIGGMAAHEVAMAAVADFNAIGGGVTLDDPPPMPHCVRYEWIDGVLCTIYNYLTDVGSCTDECPPPGATYHVVVCVPE